VLYQFAWQSTFQEPWAVAYYRRKRLAGKSHSMAVRALANVWVRLIHAMWLQGSATSPPHSSRLNASMRAARRDRTVAGEMESGWINGNRITVPLPTSSRRA
jgi:hypothetical protein